MMLELYTVAGKRVGPSLYVPASREVRSDRAGYVLAPSTGGTYHVGPGIGDIRRITTGRVDGVSADHFIVTECGERARCSRAVVSRATGQRRLISKRTIGPFAGPRQVIAPDGSIAVHIPEDGGELAVTELDTGRQRYLNVYLQSGTDEPGLVFSPDSKWLFAVEPGDDIVAIDTATFDPNDVEVPVPDITQLTVWPAR